MHQDVQESSAALDDLSNYKFKSVGRGLLVILGLGLLLRECQYAQDHEPDEAGGDVPDYLTQSVLGIGVGDEVGKRISSILDNVEVLLRETDHGEGEIQQCKGAPIIGAETAKRDVREARREEEARRAEETRKAEEEATRQEEATRAEEARKAEEEARREEEAKREEETRREVVRREEEAKIAEEKRRAEEKQTEEGLQKGVKGKSTKGKTTHSYDMTDEEGPAKKKVKSCSTPPRRSTRDKLPSKRLRGE